MFVTNVLIFFVNQTTLATNMKAIANNNSI